MARWSWGRRYDDVRISVTGCLALSALVVGQVSPQATPAQDAGGGFSWGTLGAVVAAALFAVGFVGYLFRSHRRQPERFSVYEAIRRRIDQERSEG